MTLHLLNQYRGIIREIPDLKQRIRYNRRQLAGHQEVMASMLEFPYVKQTVAVDRVSQEHMQETVRLMQRRLQRISRQRREIEQYIDAIKDSQLRQIFHLRFVDGLSWENVTIKIGGGNDIKVLQNKVYRHLQFDGK